MKFISYFFSAMLAIASLPVYAVDCENPPSGTDMASAQANYQCAEKARAIEDKRLNNDYKRLISLLKDNPEEEIMPKSQMVIAERTWIAFRDAECDFRTSLKGGAHQWLIVNHSQCLTELTEQRAKVLEKYLEQVQDQ
jgi:uncharacterized protein YecT (DUF1311 family)